jgi:hypothetical protein
MRGAMVGGMAAQREETVGMETTERQARVHDHMRFKRLEVGFRVRSESVMIRRGHMLEVCCGDNSERGYKWDQCKRLG